MKIIILEQYTICIILYQKIGLTVLVANRANRQPLAKIEQFKYYIKLQGVTVLMAPRAHRQFA